MSEITIDPERQKKAKEYARTQRRMMFVDLAIGGVYALAWLFFGWSIQLREYLESISTNQWFLVAGFLLVFGGIYFILGIPLGYYTGFILPHRYDLSTQSFSMWVLDQIKSAGLGGVLALLIIETVYLFLRIAGDTWWIWVGLILLVFNILMVNLAPILLFPIFYKFIPLGESHADLEIRLLDLARKAKTKVRGVFQFDMSRRTKAANAALVGLGNTRRIILGDTLVSEFTTEEIETVLAHELGHHVHRDIPIGILVESLFTLIGLYIASIVLMQGITFFGFESIYDVAAMPLFVIVVGLYSFLTIPLTNSYSRWREKRADQYALEITHNGDAYASALTRLANQNLAEIEPEAWEEFLLYSHPALGKRIAQAKKYSDQLSVESR
jgi:STE24 endopeptidase